MNHETHPLSSSEIIIFSPEISEFYYIKKYRRSVLVNMVTIFMISAKMATLGLPKNEGILK